MAIESVGSSAGAAQATPASADARAERSVRDVMDRLARFDGSFEQFLQHLLAVQCHMTAAEGAALLRPNSEGQLEVLTLHPQRQYKGPSLADAPAWVGRAQAHAQAVLNSGQPAHAPLPTGAELYGQPPHEHALAVPIRRQTNGQADAQAAQGNAQGNGQNGQAQPWAVGLYLVRTRDPAVLRNCVERVELTQNLLTVHELRRSLDDRRRDLDRAQGAVELVATINACDRRAEAYMAFCNEIAARWKMDRVSLGFLEGRYVKLRGLSHTEKIVRKTKLVQALESTMEECLDQDTEVVHPAPPEAPYVARAASELTRGGYGTGSVCSLPLRHNGEPVAVLTVERESDEPVGLEELETLRLVSELATAHLVDVHRNDRWIGMRVLASTRAALGKAVGPEHTWAKLAVIGVFGLLLFMIFGQGTHTVDAPFKVEAAERRVVPAPFDGFLESVEVEPGDRVEAGMVLATMDRSELRLELQAARAERARYETEADLARGEGRHTEMLIARARADGEQARIELLEHRLESMVLRSPISGYVLEGVRKRHEGSRVERGNVVFRVAPDEKLQADLFVRERHFVDVYQSFQDGPEQPVRAGADGTIATASFPGVYLPFTVERISPVAEVREQNNVFRVRIELMESQPWLKPGMEGLAKIEIGRRSYAWIWTHNLVDWVRMRLWI